MKKLRVATTVVLTAVILTVGVLTYLRYVQTNPAQAETLYLKSTINTNSDSTLPQSVKDALVKLQKDTIAKRRQTRIDKVERFFRSYGAKLQGYGHILVDQAEKCGGDYRILVGIAGSESGLGRIMYKKYNPYGYLNGVQYPNLKTALTELSCKVSRQHIAPCGDNLMCLAKRYGGPDTDLAHFANKVKWFADQVR